MQILGLLGMYFDAVVIEVEKYLLFSDWLSIMCEERSAWITVLIHELFHL